MTPEQHANTVERLAEEIADSAAILYGNGDIRFSGSKSARLALMDALKELVALAERADTLEHELDDLKRALLELDDAGMQARAEADRLRETLRKIDAVVEAWANDETPDVDHPFDADMDFLNYVDHIARAALAGPQTEEQT